MSDSGPAGQALLRLVGVDVGGTTTQIQAIDVDGTPHELVRRSSGWRVGPLLGDPEGPRDLANVDRLAETIASVGRIDASTVLAAGIHDCDTDEEMAVVADRLRVVLGCRVEVVNDALLLRYATPERSTVEMIVGTGAIVSGTTAEGARVTADGHGWPVGDRGSAPDLVHAAVVATLEAGDRREDDDPLYPAVRAAFGARTTAELALRAREDLDPARWGSRASTVFDAWHAGSATAHWIVSNRAGRLADAVVTVRRNGAVGRTVVAGGGVIANQPRYEAMIRHQLSVRAPEVELVVVRTPPAAGALALAREIADGAAGVDVGVARAL